MLEIDQLQVQPGESTGRPVLTGVSLRVQRGEAVGLIGPSGCGKTTLLRSVAGLIDPAGGTVTFDGKAPDEWGWPEFRRRVMLVPQRPVVWGGTVCENLLRPRGFGVIKHQYLRGDAERMLGEVGLADKLDAIATTLSEGEMQRVSLVRALLTEPNMMLLDEPTSALDDESVGWVEALVRYEMNDLDGAGALVATHDRAFAERFCSTVINLADFMPAGKAAADA